MKKLLLGLAFVLGVAPSLYAVFPIIGTVQVNPPNPPQAGSFNISSGTVNGQLSAGSLAITGLAPNGCMQTGSGGAVTVTGLPCGSGGGGAGGTTGGINNASQYSATYYSVPGSSNVLSGLAAGTSGQILTTGGSSVAPYWSSGGFIQNVATLQSGATFYVSSGSVLGTFTAAKVNVSTVQIGGLDFLSDQGAASSVFLGDQAFPSATAGINNICIGQQTCNTYTSSNFQNVVIGNRAGRNLIGANNSTCIGDQACGGLDTTGSGFRNTAVGGDALSAVGAGTENTAVGWGSCGGVTSGSNNECFGFLAGNVISSGAGNSIFGSNSGGALTNAFYNTMFGFDNGGMPKGSSNTILGAAAGNGTITVNPAQDVSGNTFVGYGAGSGENYSDLPLTKSICIGYNCRVTSSNTAVVGGSGVDAVNVIVTSLTVSALPSGRCVQTGTGGLFGVTAGLCGAGGGTPGGSAGQLQWNSAGSFAGAANTIVTASSVTFGEPILVTALTDTGLSASLPVLTDSNKQLTTGNIPMSNVSGILATANGGTGLGAATNNSVLTGNGSSWQADAIPSCSGAAQATQFNTGTDSFACLSQIGILTASQTFSGVNNWTTTSISTFSFAVSAGSVTTTGPGNGQVILTIGVGSAAPAPFSATSSSGGVTAGQFAAWSSTNGTIANGGYGPIPTGPINTVEYNANGTHAGSNNFQFNGTSVTVISSMSITSNGTKNVSTGLLDVFHGAAAVGTPILTAGSINFQNQFSVKDQSPVEMLTYGANIGSLKIANSGTGDRIIDNNNNTQFIDYWNNGEMDFQTSAGSIVFKPNLVAEVTVSTMGFTVSTNTAVTTGYLQLYSRTRAQIAAITPVPTTPGGVVTGQEYYCSDCTTTSVCISTGSAKGAFSTMANLTTVCN